MTQFAESTCEVPPHAIETVSGRYVDVVAPDPKSIVVEDIGWALARQARFAGHTLSDEVWNVAQHSNFVCDLVDMGLDPENNCGLAGSLSQWMMEKGHGASAHCKFRGRYATPVLMGALMHDGTEAFLIDLPSPVKRHQLLRGPYKEMEAKMEVAIREALHLPELSEIEHEIIVWADLMALQIEAANLMPSRGRGWSGVLPVFKIEDMNLFPAPVRPWKTSYDRFMIRFRELWKDLSGRE